MDAERRLRLIQRPHFYIPHLGITNLGSALFNRLKNGVPSCRSFHVLNVSSVFQLFIISILSLQLVYNIFTNALNRLKDRAASITNNLSSHAFLLTNEHLSI